MALASSVESKEAWRKEFQVILVKVQGGKLGYLKLEQGRLSTGVYFQVAAAQFHFQDCFRRLNNGEIKKIKHKLKLLQQKAAKYQILLD